MILRLIWTSMEFWINPNQHIYIPKETLHRMENIGDEVVEFVETQIGEYLGEEDIVRYEDDFGRVWMICNFIWTF